LHDALDNLTQKKKQIPSSYLCVLLAFTAPTLLAEQYPDLADPGTGLDPNGLYSLVFFGHPQYVPGVYPAGSITTIDGVGTGATAGASEWDYDFTNVQAVGGKISGTFVSPAGWNTWSGLQFEQTGVVPEPSTTALLGLGGLALILRRRK